MDNAKKSGLLADWRLASACVVSYAAFLRFDELVHIKAMDVKFQDDYMVLPSQRVRLTSFEKETK